MSGKVGDALTDLDKVEYALGQAQMLVADGMESGAIKTGVHTLSALLQAQAAIPRIEAALSASPQDGWVLVPREPTEAMLRAAQAVAELHILGDWSNAECKSDEERADKSNRDYYRAMIEAAPALPQPTGDGT